MASKRGASVGIESSPQKKQCNQSVLHQTFENIAKPLIGVVDGQMESQQKTLSTLRSSSCEGDHAGNGYGNSMIKDMAGDRQVLEDKLSSRGRLHVVVLTGGPCAGKSTVMTELKKELEDQRVLVFQMPEVATMMDHWSGNRMWADFGEADDNPNSDRAWAELQVAMTRIQIQIEDTILQLARRSLARRRQMEDPPRMAVVLLDRGVIDNKAYCTDAVWSMLVEMLGTTTARLRDQRYDHVIHMVTAANGTNFYTLDQAEGGVSSRTETADEAVACDRSIQAAWQGCNSFHIIDNQGDFEHKKARVKDTVKHLIGLTQSGAGGVEHLSVRSIKKRVACRYMPRQQLCDLVDRDPGTKWPAVTKVKTTLLSKNDRVQRCISEAGNSVVYYSQQLEDDGSNLRQYQLNAWEYADKIKIAQGAEGGALQEIDEDVVSFSHDDTAYRCHFLQENSLQPLLLVDVEGNAQSVADPSAVFPSWLQAERCQATEATTM